MERTTFHSGMTAATLVSLTFHVVLLFAGFLIGGRILPAGEMPQVQVVSLILASRAGERSGSPVAAGTDGKDAAIRENIGDSDAGRVLDVAETPANRGRAGPQEPAVPDRRLDEEERTGPPERDRGSNALSDGTGAVALSGISAGDAPPSPGGLSLASALPSEGDAGKGVFPYPAKEEGMSSGGKASLSAEGKGNAPAGGAASSGNMTGGSAGGAVHAATGGGASGVGSLVFAFPRYSENFLPPYPLLARKRGLSGVVVLAVEVLSDGRVGKLETKKSSGYAILDRAAFEAVRKWKFTPGRKMGKPVAMWVEVPVRFALN